MIQTEHPSASLLNLPTELFDPILDHLSNYKSSLKSCCLASRAFLPAAQALLFRRVVLYADPNYPIPHFRAGTKLRHLVELPHLLSHTREFLINGGYIIDHARYCMNVDTELLPALEAFISLKNSHITTGCGHSLQYISLVQVNWRLSSLNAALQRLLALESVMHIVIGRSDVPLNIFDHFPSGVKILELAYITFQDSPAAVAQVPDGYPKLVSLPAIRPETLIIKEKRKPGTLAAIFNNPSRECDGTSIRTLHIFGLTAHEFGTYVNFAPHVENFTLRMSKRTAREHTSLDFSQFSRLRSLHMRMYAASHVYVDREIRWLAQSLRHTNTGSLFRSITLTYLPDEIYDIPAWAELDSVLAGPQFESENFSGMTIKVSDLPSTDFYSFLLRTIDKKLLKVVKSNTAMNFTQAFTDMA